MDSLVYEFTDLPIWSDAGWRAGTIDGYAEITYSSFRDFTVDDIAILADNANIGDAAQSRRVWLGNSNPLLPILLRSLLLNRRSSIENAIVLREAAQVLDAADRRHAERAS